MLTINKVFTFLSTLPVWEAFKAFKSFPGSFQNKLLSSSYKSVPKYILFLARLRGKGRPFSNGKA